MENQIASPTPKKSWYKNKALVATMSIILMATFVIAASQLFSTSNVTVTVPEPLSDSGGNINIPTAFPNETIQRNFSITNSGPNPLIAQLFWTQDSNPNGVTYVTNLPINVSVPNGTTVVSVTWTPSSDTPIGGFNGTVTKLRR